MSRRKLIEVALPLKAISDEASLRKRKAPAGYPTTLHKWWAQRPVAAARAVLFAQFVDDPASLPEEFPTEKAQEKERQRLFRLIEKLVLWENSNDEEVLHAARREIARSIAREKGIPLPELKRSESADFLRIHAPPVLDPFCGGGSIPLEAQRLGMRALARDLNPVAILVTKGLVEVPAAFLGQSPINPESGKQARVQKGSGKRDATGLAADVRYYGKWVRDRAHEKLRHLYPPAKISPSLARERPELAPYVGKDLDVVAWLWARTVTCSNPACRGEVPLLRTFSLCTKKGKEAWVELRKDPKSRTVAFDVKTKGAGPAEGTVANKSATCVHCDSTVDLSHVRSEGMQGRLGKRLLAVVCDGTRGRIHLPPEVVPAVTLSPAETKVVREAREGPLAGATPEKLTGGTCFGYGLTTWGALFTDRQVLTHLTISSLVRDVVERIRADAAAVGMPDDDIPFDMGGRGARAYAEAIAFYLALAASRAQDYGSTLATWRPKDNAMRSSLPKQALQMTWDFAEGSAFGESSSGYSECVAVVAKVIDLAYVNSQAADVRQANACAMSDETEQVVVSTDPPYYSNVGYSDLSDFFYCWLRLSLGEVFPHLFSTVSVPKAEELVASRHRQGSQSKAEEFFLHGMTQAMSVVARRAHPSYPVAVFYAFKQAEEEEDDEGIASTGWETFLGGLLDAWLAIVGTWPMRTEGDNRQVGIGANALASSIVLACRPRSASAPLATRRDFVAALKRELPAALRKLQEGNVAPVDLAQAAIGPGMAVYSRYSKVLEADGSRMDVRAALQLINQELDAFFSEEEGEMDADTRFAVAWFEQHQYDIGPYGEADTLARAKNTSVDGLKQSGILEAKSGKVRLLERSELDQAWDPRTDTRLTVWECTQHLIRVLDKEGEDATARLAALLAGRAQDARAIAYRMYSVCERKKWAEEARAFNNLVLSWPVIEEKAARIASEFRGPLDRFTPDQEEEE
jgi:putative DNA methylase